jgi:hypothetical protein
MFIDEAEDPVNVEAALNPSDQLRPVNVRAVETEVNDVMSPVRRAIASCPSNPRREERSHGLASRLRERHPLRSQQGLRRCDGAYPSLRARSAPSGPKQRVSHHTFRRICPMPKEEDDPSRPAHVQLHYPMHRVPRDAP